MTAMAADQYSQQDQSTDRNTLETDDKQQNIHGAGGKADTPGASSTQRDEDESKYLTGTQLWLVLISLCLSVFLVALDQTIIAPALGAITTEFASIKDIGWYGSSYLMTTTVMQPLYGSIYHSFDIKTTFLGEPIELFSYALAASPVRFPSHTDFYQAPLPSSN